MNVVDHGAIIRPAQGFAASLHEGRRSSPRRGGISWRPIEALGHATWSHTWAMRWRCCFGSVEA
jgi:hypothetical protein